MLKVWEEPRAAAAGGPKGGPGCRRGGRGWSGRAPERLPPRRKMRPHGGSRGGTEAGGEVHRLSFRHASRRQREGGRARAVLAPFFFAARAQLPGSGSGAAGRRRRREGGRDGSRRGSGEPLP